MTNYIGQNPSRQTDRQTDRTELKLSLFYSREPYLRQDSALFLLLHIITQRFL